MLPNNNNDAPPDHNDTVILKARITRDLHRAIKAKAAMEGLTIGQWLTWILQPK